MADTCESNKLEGEVPSPYHKKRFWFFGIFTAISLLIPWVKIGDGHIFLLSFDKKQLHLLGTIFDMQEFYLMPFLLMFFFLFIFFITVLGGRVWCGWGCPQTIFRVIYRDLIQGVLLGLRKRRNKQNKLKGEFVKRAIAFVIWSFLAFVAASNFTWFFVPPEDYLVYLQNPAGHSVLVTVLAILTLFLIYDVVKLKEDWCSYVCPYVRMQSTLYDHDTIYTIYNNKRGGKIYDGDTKLWSKPPAEEDECTGCEACVKVCPTGIDIRKGLQMECINCLECVDACTAVMGKLGKKSLVNWDSNRSYFDGNPTKYLRPKTIGYGVIMIGIVIALFIMGGNKEHMLLNINKSNSIYKVRGSSVSNDYVFLFVNTDNKDHKYFFEVEGRDDIAISRPKYDFTVKAGQKTKKIVVLTTEQKIGANADTYTKLPLTIKAYAVDDKEKIVVTRKTVFVYPPLNEMP